MVFVAFRGATDKHLLLVDLSDSHPGLTGKDAEAALETINVVVNKNTVPGKTRSPFITSGIRIGTPCVTTGGFSEHEMETVGEGIIRTLDAPGDEWIHNELAENVARLCEEHPVYQ